MANGGPKKPKAKQSRADPSRRSDSEWTRVRNGEQDLEGGDSDDDVPSRGRECQHMCVAGVLMLVGLLSLSAPDYSGQTWPPRSSPSSSAKRTGTVPLPVPPVHGTGPAPLPAARVVATEHGQQAESDTDANARQASPPPSHWLPPPRSSDVISPSFEPSPSSRASDSASAIALPPPYSPSPSQTPPPSPPPSSPPSPSPSPSSSPPPPSTPTPPPPPLPSSPEPKLHWEIHKGTNCWWGGNGAAAEIETPKGSAAPDLHTLEECKAACVSLYPTCGGLLFNKGNDGCYRKGTITVSQCRPQTDLDLYVLLGPPPPAPPHPPPRPPRTPMGRGIAGINEQFRKGKPSDELADVGVLMHMWDGQEELGKPWKMCLTNCLCQGSRINGRISSMIIYRGLHDRSDRKTIPLPFGGRGGILIHPSFAAVDCLYGIDGGTYRLDDPRHPGCSDEFCNPNNIFDQNGNVWCGFNGAPAMAWSPRDIKKLLELHAQYGPAWHGPGFHSGYNEAILNSKLHNAALPQSVMAFFVPKGHSTVTSDLGYGIMIDVVEAHRAFLREYGLSADDVPMVELDTANWDEPFTAYRG